MPAKFSLKHEHRPCSSRCSRKKTRGLAFLLGVAREPRPAPIRGWVADLFCVKTRGVRRGDLALWLEFHVRKRCKVREFYLWASPAKLVLWLIILTLLAELWGNDWLVISFRVGRASRCSNGLDWLSRDSVQAPCMKSTQIYYFVYP